MATRSSKRKTPRQRLNPAADEDFLALATALMRLIRRGWLAGWGEAHAQIQRESRRKQRRAATNKSARRKRR